MRKAVFYLAIDFLGDTRFMSEDESKVEAWIAEQWNKEIYIVKTMDLLVSEWFWIKNRPNTNG